MPSSSKIICPCFQNKGWRIKEAVSWHYMPPTPQCLCSSIVLLFRAPFLCSYTWRTTEWSDCRVDLLLSQQDRRRSNLTGLCGGGLQTREVYCVQANAELLKYLNDLRDKDKGNDQKVQMMKMYSVIWRCDNVAISNSICILSLFV